MLLQGISDAGLSVHSIANAGKIMLLMSGAVCKIQVKQLEGPYVSDLSQKEGNPYLCWKQGKPCSSLHVLDVSVVESLHG